MKLEELLALNKKWSEQVNELRSEVTALKAELAEARKHHDLVCADREKIWHERDELRKQLEAFADGSRLSYQIVELEKERDELRARCEKYQEALEEIGKWFPKPTSSGGIAAQLSAIARLALADALAGEKEGT